MENSIAEIQKIISDTRNLLCDFEMNTQQFWGDIYQKYIEMINLNKDFILTARKKFHVPAPFGCYVTLGGLTRENKRIKQIDFSLRVCGQEVAIIRVQNSEKPKLYMDEKKCKDNRKYFVQNESVEHPFQEEYTGVDWKNSAKAKKIRKFFAELDFSVIKTHFPEHKIEFLLLKEFAKNKKEEKAILFIQPLKIANSILPFTTVVSASGNEVKKGGKNNGALGGGIDILARTRKGNKSYLTVIEVKDENKDKEPPLKVFKQAVSYAVFIRELLRSSHGEDWWNFMGMSGKIPQSLVIRVACAMPKNKKLSAAVSDLEQKRIAILGTEDFLEIHTIYFECNNGKLENFEHSFYG